MTLLILGEPRTKKNSSRVIVKNGRVIVLPSKPYKEYAQVSIAKIPAWKRCKINKPVNLKCVYYMSTHRRVDLVNLLEATCDILVEAGVLEDDNSQIVASHDGSRVDYDKFNPRVEIDIEEIDHEKAKQGSIPGRAFADARKRDDESGDR